MSSSTQGIGRLNIAPQVAVIGCTDSSALNYDPTANVDDDSCIPVAVVNGCTDSSATNYDSAANTDDGSCVYAEVVDGCMDINAINYNVNATTNSGCEYLGCLDTNAVNYGMFDVSDSLTYSWVDANNTSHTQILADITQDCSNYLGSGNNICCEYTEGCTDPTALNYNTNATQDDGSCLFNPPPLPTYGCTDPAAFNYDPLATDDDGSCIGVGNGCTDSTMFNYDPAATVDDGSCLPFQYGCNIPSAFNYSQVINTDDGSCVWYGCTDDLAINTTVFPTEATDYQPTSPYGIQNDGSCIYSTAF